jgi:modification methylase
LKQLPINEILHGDCIEVLAGLPEKSVDVIFADPPYNLQLYQELWRPNQTKVDAVSDEWDKFDDFSAYDCFTKDWLSACRRVLKQNGTLWVIGTYHNIYRIGKVLQDLEYWILNDVVWIKTNPMPNFQGVRFTNAHEILIWAQKDQGMSYTFNHHSMKALNEDLQMRSDWLLPICSGSERIRIENGQKAHPTQKPESLLYRVILASSNPGDIILDPFFGSGTTGAVAKRLHRRWIGIESQQKYIDLARKRIADTPQVKYEEELFQSPNPRKRRRIPFGKLVEQGYLQPGQFLYLGKKGETTARVLADGSIESNGKRGSIHQVAKKLLGAPSNGWEQWYFLDTQTGERKPIDHLRCLMRDAGLT